MIKKVVISVAGEGTRMKHLTKNKPKSLINVLGRPFLAQLLDNVLKAGYQEIILITGYKAEKIEDFIKKSRYNKITKLVNQFKVCGTQKYGTAIPLMAARDTIGKNNFISIYGDNLYSVKDLQEMNINDKYNYIAGLKHPNPQKYGVLFVKNGFLEKIVEKPKNFVGDLINVGLYKFTPEIFEKIKKIRRSKRGEYELTDAISLLAKEKKVKAKILKDYWLDFGNPADIIKVSRFLKQNKAR